MNATTGDHGQLRLLLEPFPMPVSGELRAAFRDLFLAAEGTEEHKRAIGDPSGLPRPWEPATCNKPELRAELWAWLDQVVGWYNRQCAWEPDRIIPTCWPHHPHLVRDIAVLADLRRRAQLALTSDLLEEWHRYTVPAFLERLKNQTRGGCDNQHTPWPARARATRYDSEQSRRDRYQAFRDDLDALEPPEPPAPTRPILGVVDPETGEINQP